MSYFSPQALLSQASRDRCITKFKKVPELFFGTKRSEKKGSVLLPLCIVDDKVSLVYTLRSANLNKYRAHISFPGGKCDPEDIDTVATALRETEEELGLPRETIDVWGEGTPVPARNNEMCVHPVIGYVKNFNINKLKPNPHEVEQVFTVPIQSLCDPKNAGHTQFNNGIIMPVFQYEKRKIWGLTAYITHTFLSSLIPKEHYRNDFLQKKIRVDFPQLKHKL